LAIDRGMGYGRQEAQEVAQRRVDAGSRAGEFAPLLTLDQQLVGEKPPPDLAQPALDPQRELGSDCSSRCRSQHLPAHLDWIPTGQ
jgi:hypothetical protein